ncbi:trypsin-like peptidase domain-containing protein [Streptococcus cuniculi]|nr:trypsin-like peptidase domain-containing protein [Streptococcus cuniculi]MBF0777970.1 trypsin-like peptidase domain-containing protein [Streptococcus cuniculi]
MIAPNKALTAAHCLRNVETNEWAESVVVYPAYAGGHAPYGGATGWTYHVLSSFKNDLATGEYGYTRNKVENDIAVITLSRSLPDVGFLSVTNQVAMNQKVQVVGYPSDKGEYMYAASGPVLESSDRLLRYQIDTYGGNSGGPVLDANNRIVAINIASPKEGVNTADYLQRYGRNSARRINQEALALIDYAKNNRNSAKGISKVIATFRLYHPGLKYHLYTTDANEKNVLAGQGWNDEGVAWRTDTQGKPVYRLYHAGIKKHVYTTDSNEKNVLARSGWKYEGITWYSSGTKPVYRLYQPDLKVHLYTMDTNEKNVLSTRGWKYEGVAWNVE